MSPRRTRGPALRRIGAPCCLLLARLLERRGQPVLRVFDLHYPDRAQLAVGHHLASLPYQRIAGVVVGHGKEDAGTAHHLGQVASVFKSGGEWLVANDVNASFEKCFCRRVVQMVRCDDGHGVNAIFSLRLR